MRKQRIVGVGVTGVMAAAMLGVAAPVAAQDEVTLDLWNFGAMGLEELIDQYPRTLTDGYRARSAPTVS
jgi:hypothetical protein